LVVLSEVIAWWGALDAAARDHLRTPAERGAPAPRPCGSDVGAAVDGTAAHEHLAGEQLRAEEAFVMKPESVDPSRYDTHLDNKYGYRKVVDIPGEVARHKPWFNQTLTQVNDSVVRLGIIEGEYHWHKHDTEDEFFLVLEGELLIDLEGGETVTLGHHLGYTVPKGVVHRTRAPTRTVILMVEAATVTPTGNP
jgi:mannose-6-phosphate isomerase-like protein (cupin superfamily)